MYDEWEMMRASLRLIDKGIYIFKNHFQARPWVHYSTAIREDTTIRGLCK